MPTVSSAYLSNYVETCIALGAPAQRLYDLVPGGRAAMDVPDGRFPGDVVVRVLDVAAELTGNDTLGLRVGMQFRPATFMDVGYALSSAGTIRQALEINMRFQPLTQEVVCTGLEVRGAHAYIRCAPALAGVEGLRRVMEAVFAGYAVIGHWLLRDHSSPIEAMHFRHRDPGPQTHEMYETVFGKGVKFGQKEDVMVFRAELVSRPLPGENQALVTLLTQRLEERMISLRDGVSLADKVRNCLHGQMRRGRPSMAGTARLLGYSERTLRRHLAEAGIGFSDLLQDARKEAADIYVREGKLSLTEIAGALGYGDQSAFVRAFRGWYGISPGVYRKQAKEG
ncbi:AraC family transcriptional regulator [Hyphomonas sp. WL0036]|uniref:AraC family transcriptional regulator n=1 Tax=Hyphomonas sediminis TaxID=2866160 RepID=UPI001C8142D3|nr:AraC family transcriptional regulator [Hyphomonas sediminis]MBY9068264.1 AraC family transcriptional regulator [Hyphomonas sediminis]